MEPLMLCPRSELIGKKYGIQIIGKNEIYVSPAAYSLYKTDYKSLVSSLRIKLINETDPGNPLIKKIRRRKKPFDSKTLTTRGGHLYGLLPDVFINDDQRRNLPEMQT